MGRNLFERFAETEFRLLNENNTERNCFGQGNDFEIQGVSNKIRLCLVLNFQLEDLSFNASQY